MKKNSLYIGIVVRGKGPDVLFSSGQFVHMPDGKTPLRFSQDTFTFQAKHFGVSSKTLRCLQSNAKAFHPKRLGVLRTSGTTFPRNGSKLFFERRSVCDRTPKSLEAHAETFFPDTQRKFKSVLSQIASNKSNFNNFKELLWFLADTGVFVYLKIVRMGRIEELPVIVVITPDFA